MDSLLQKNLAYHYTSFDTLLKLLDGADEENMFFHASSIFSLNDPSELRYGYNAVVEMMPELEEELHVDADYRLSRILNIGLNELSIDYLREKSLKLFQESSAYHPFVISLSKERESLPMWRLYGDNGNGVSIGIDSRMYLVKKNRNDELRVLDMSHIEMNNLHSIDVEYGALSKSNIPYLAMRYEYCSYLKEVKGKTDSSQIFKEQFKAIGSLMMLVAPHIKHSAYEYERETRIERWCHDLKDIKFKSINEKILPYVEIPIPKSYLKEIIIGPCLDAISTRSCIALKLKQNGFTDYEITESIIPYRK